MDILCDDKVTARIEEARSIYADKKWVKSIETWKAGLGIQEMT